MGSSPRPSKSDSTPVSLSWKPQISAPESLEPSEPVQLYLCQQDLVERVIFIREAMVACWDLNEGLYKRGEIYGRFSRFHVVLQQSLQEEIPILLQRPFRFFILSFVVRFVKIFARAGSCPYTSGQSQSFCFQGIWRHSIATRLGDPCNQASTRWGLQEKTQRS